MRALFAEGRQVEALAVFDEGQRSVAEEYGLELSDGLVELRQQILTGAYPGPVLPPRATFARGRSLPENLDSTVGRDDVLDELGSMLMTPGVRLVSLLGPGGVGKTRVAVDLGRRLGSSFRHGVVFVPLIEAEKPSDVAVTVCARLGMRVTGNPAAALELALSGQEILLIFDNFEHVMDAADVVTMVLAAAPQTRALASWCPAMTTAMCANIMGLPKSDALMRQLGLF